MPPIRPSQTRPSLVVEFQPTCSGIMTRGQEGDRPLGIVSAKPASPRAKSLPREQMVEHFGDHEWDGSVLHLEPHRIGPLPHLQDGRRGDRRARDQVSLASAEITEREVIPVAGETVPESGRDVRQSLVEVS